MIDTSAFKTRTEILPKVFPVPFDMWPVGLDIGYSGVKGVCPNKVFCFPSYAKKIPENRQSMRDTAQTDIYYRDKNGMWSVGEMAYAEISQSETAMSEAGMYGRNRYFSQMFLVIARTGFALAMTPNGLGAPKGRRMVIQTGLPTQYAENDKDDLKEALAGHHRFEVRVGRGKWESYDFELRQNDISVMAQPVGALLSVVFQADGKQIPDAGKYFNSNVVISDPGFGTYDEYTLRHGMPVNENEGDPTNTGLGMHEVLDRTCKEIKSTYGAEVTVSSMQNMLANGTVSVVDRRAMSRQKKPFGDILEKNLKAVCNELIENMVNTHGYLSDTDYIITTGGTYDAWKSFFDGRFKDMEGLAIIPANINDPGLPNIYSNARGYYFNIAARAGRKA